MPSASFTARAAVDGVVCGLGGVPPVVMMTAAMTATRQASQPMMNARPLRVPLPLLKIKIKAVRGNGSRAIASPMSMRSSTTWPPPYSSGSAGRHRSRSAKIRPDATASRRAW